MNQHRGAKTERRYELLTPISPVSQRTFYPSSDAPSIEDHRITMACFRTCLTRWSRSSLLDKAGPLGGSGAA
jgi:hypothetical protein